jgi:Domain of unknown function (DUF4278)
MIQDILQMFIREQIFNINTVKRTTQQQSQINQNKTMKLIYRGTTYNYDPIKAKNNPPVQHIDKSAYKLIYRGSTYRFDPAIAKVAAVKPHSYELIYRGSTYLVNRNEAGKVTGVTYSVNTFQHKTLTNHSAISKIADKHLEKQSH